MILQVPPMLPKADRLTQHNPEVYGNDITTYRSTYTEHKVGVPQLLLVEQPNAGSTLLPHYHASDQFQVFMDGSGELGKHAVRPIAIHYTNKYTGYGPIVAGPQGVTYYVFRPSFDPLGAGQYVHRAESRELVKDYRGRRRMLMADDIPLSDRERLATLTQMQQTTLFTVPQEESDGGTLAAVIELGPAMRHQITDPASGGGQVILVLAGELSQEATRLGPRAAIAVTRDEPALTLMAGEQGAQVLLLQYPKPHDLT